MRTLIIGMKTVVWSLTNFQGGAQQSQQMGQPPTTSGFREGELRRASGFVANGVRCLALYQGAECAEMCTHFAEALAVLDPRNFLDIVCLRRALGGAALRAPRWCSSRTCCCRPRSDDASPTRSPRTSFAIVSPRFPSRRLRSRSSCSNSSPCSCTRANTATAKRCYRRDIVPLVEACLKAMREVDDPSAYVRLLRYLFRALAQAKFDLLYREVVPVLQPCLDTLLALLHRAGHAFRSTTRWWSCA